MKAKSDFSIQILLFSEIPKIPCATTFRVDEGRGLVSKWHFRVEIMMEYLNRTNKTFRTHGLGNGKGNIVLVRGLKT